MTDDDAQTGGPDWERNEAAKRMGKAVADGDVAALIESADRLGDAVVNASAARLIPTLRTTLEVVLNKQIGPIARQGDAIANNQIGLASKLNEWQHKTDRRLDALADGQNEIEAKQDAIATALQEVRGGMGKTQADIKALSARVEARETLDDQRYEESRDIHQKSMDHRRRLDASVHALEHELEGVKQELQRLIAERGGDGR